MKRSVLKGITTSLVLVTCLIGLTGCSALEHPNERIYKTHLQRYKTKAYTESFNNLEVGILEENEIYDGGRWSDVDYIFIDGDLVPIATRFYNTPQEELDRIWYGTEHGEYYQEAFEKHWNDWNEN